MKYVFFACDPDLGPNCLHILSTDDKKAEATLLLYKLTTVRVYVRLDILFSLIWIQTVCKDYQQMTKKQKQRFYCIKLTTFRV